MPTFCLTLLDAEDRRSIAQSSFVAALLLDCIDASALFLSIPLYVPSRTLRTRPPIFIPIRRTAVDRNDPILNAFKMFNTSSYHYDFNFFSFPSYILYLNIPFLPKLTVFSSCCFSLFVFFLFSFRCFVRLD